MQKVIRATDRAKTQAQRKRVAEQTHNRIINRKLRINEMSKINLEVRTRIIAARTARREDWLMGPLAPRRDVGNFKETYGTVSPRQLRSPPKEKGQWKDWCIREGDRVVVVGARHRERGNIGKVKNVREASEECTVSGLNMVDVATPLYMMEATADKRPIQTTEGTIKLSDVRLVHPLFNPETGIKRDVIINELKTIEVPEDPGRFWGPKVKRRYIAGVEPRRYIPFPKVGKPKHQDHDGDTLRIEIDEWTWMPTLLGPPMPSTVIDELRNKYSVFRDRHDDEYIQKREESAASREDWKRRKAEMMLTPLQEFNKKQRAEKRKLGWTPLDQGTMEKIGQVMARNGAKVAQPENQTS